MGLNMFSGGKPMGLSELSAAYAVGSGLNQKRQAAWRRFT